MFFGLYGAIFFGLPIGPLRFFLVSNPRDGGGLCLTFPIYNRGRLHALRTSGSAQWF
jgi:hypothetical protein